MKKLQTNKVITLICSALLFVGTSLFAEEMIETSDDVLIEDASINLEDMNINGDIDLGTTLARGDKCGGDDSEDSDAKCGEGKCGDDAKEKMKHKCGEGKCGDDAKEKMKHKCGEGKCGDDAKEKMNGKCGGEDDDDDADHKCGR
ncbi:MAG: putative low-complexity protein [Chlamydiales bacterium]|jgi:uncharacterized low-complexity protein